MDVPDAQIPGFVFLLHWLKIYANGLCVEGVSRLCNHRPLRESGAAVAVLVCKHHLLPRAERQPRHQMHRQSHAASLMSGILTALGMRGYASEGGDV